MTARRVLPSLLMSLVFAAALPAHGGDEAGPRPRVGADPAKAKAQRAEGLRLIAKLRNDAPKLDDVPPPPHPLSAPIFHRHDRR